MTRGLLNSLESDNEVAAILAHEIAHVESRHSYRIWRNAQRASTVAGIVGLFARGTDNNVDDIVAIHDLLYRQPVHGGSRARP